MKRGEKDKEDAASINLPLDVLYSEGAQNVRHYSNASLAIRVLAVGQGLLVLYAGGYLILETRVAYALMVLVFGLFFTGVLFLVHWGYYKACQSFYETLERIERKYAEEAFAPVWSYASERKQRYRRFIARLFTIHGAFTLVGLACLLMLCVVAVQAWST